MGHGHSHLSCSCLIIVVWYKSWFKPFIAKSHYFQHQGAIQILVMNSKLAVDAHLVEAVIGILSVGTIKLT